MNGNDMPPLWVYGEDGIELQRLSGPAEFGDTVDLGNILDINPEDIKLTDAEGCEVELKFDRKTIWKIKLLFLKAAIKFFFMRVKE